jgi:chromatin segregation and condensation protein Rec8/ScpA/Scc1 (kleisin family)
MRSAAISLLSVSAALFLAVLEMVRMQAVVVAQKDLFGEIALQRHQNFDAVFANEQPMAAIEKDYN